MECTFCKIVKGDIPSYTIYEDEIVKVFLDINPSTNGDLLIIPKSHIQNIMDMREETLSYINQTIKKLYPILTKKLGCKGLTLVQNNDHGQEIKHFHIHITPRYPKDGLRHLYSKAMLKPIEEVYEMLKKEQ